MADFTIDLTVPDAKITEFIEAVRWRYDAETLVTTADVKARFKQEVVELMKETYTNHREYLATLAEAEVPPDIT